jgi:polysaccharide export outer membrane protein
MTRIKLCAAILGFSLWLADGQGQTTQDARYMIHAGDQITVSYTYTPEFNETVTVTADGFLPLLVGKEVQVLGKTLEQAKTLIAKSGAADRLHDPVVVLTVSGFEKPYFVVAGEAFAPQRYELREHLTVLQALMLAGGTKITGKDKQIVVLHNVGTPQAEVHVLNFKHIQSASIFKEDMPIHPSDIIFIPRNRITKAQQVMSLITAPSGYANDTVIALRP